MKFTFLRPKKVGYYEMEDGKKVIYIAEGKEKDYFFTNEPKEVERLKNLKDFGYQVFSYEEISEEVVEKKEKKEKKKEKEKVKAQEEAENVSLEELHELYMKKFEKDKVPPNKKNDIEWLKTKIAE